MAPICGGGDERSVKRLLGLPLQPGIEGGKDAQPLGKQIRGIVIAPQLAAHQINERRNTMGVHHTARGHTEFLSARRDRLLVERCEVVDALKLLVQAKRLVSPKFQRVHELLKQHILQLQA